MVRYLHEILFLSIYNIIFQLFMNMTSLKQLLLESEKKWEIPKFEDEIEGFEKITDELDIKLEKIRKNFSNGELRMLPKSIWEKLKNTDSTKTQSFHDLVQVLQKYQKKNPEYQKDWKTIKNGMEDSMNKMVAPIVIKHKNDYYLVSGNCRLMVAKALNITPFIYLIVA